MSPQQPTFDIFVIHAVQDLSLIESIQEIFSRDAPRVRILVAERRRRPGVLLAEKIRELIDDCHLVIVIWTHNLERSIMANHEIGYACALQKPIFPFIIRGMTLRGFLSGTEYIECDSFRPENDIQTLLDEIRHLAAELGYHM